MTEVLIVRGVDADTIYRDHASGTLFRTVRGAINWNGSMVCGFIFNY